MKSGSTSEDGLQPKNIPQVGNTMIATRRREASVFSIPHELCVLR